MGVRGAIGWSSAGIRAEESHVQRPRDSVAPEQCLEQGEQLGREHTQLGRELWGRAGCRLGTRMGGSWLFWGLESQAAFYRSRELEGAGSGMGGTLGLLIH